MQCMRGNIRDNDEKREILSKRGIFNYLNWNEAKLLISENKDNINKAYAGLAEDWGYNSSLVFIDGKYIPPASHTCYHSSWATPILVLELKNTPDGKGGFIEGKEIEIPCYYESYDDKEQNDLPPYEFWENFEPNAKQVGNPGAGGGPVNYEAMWKAKEELMKENEIFTDFLLELKEITEKYIDKLGIIEQG